MVPGKRSRAEATTIPTGPSAGFVVPAPFAPGGASSQLSRHSVVSTVFVRGGRRTIAGGVGAGRRGGDIGRKGGVGGGFGSKLDTGTPSSWVVMSSSASNDDAAEDAADSAETVEYVQSSAAARSSKSDERRPVPRSDEPYLYDIPTGLHPSYRPAPLWIKALIALGSGLTSAALTWGPQILLSVLRPGSFPFVGWGGDGAATTVASDETSKGLVRTARKVLRFLALFLATSAATFGVAQDVLPNLRPSRIDTGTLMREYWLPSELSRFRRVDVRPIAGREDDVDEDEEEAGGKEEKEGRSAKLGVHYLRYDADRPPQNRSRRRRHRFDALHLNHGFGASSLSWLPALPSLVRRLDARAGVGHDAPGFGFTDRPHPRSGLKTYGSGGSASIGMELLGAVLDESYTYDEEEGGKENASDAEDGGLDDDAVKSVCLMGHSMGCVATLLMARSLPPETRKFVVLVAPALTGKLPLADPDPDVALDAARSTAPSNSQSLRKVTRALRAATFPLRSFVTLLRLLIFDPVASYSLRRLVAGRDFWLRGLQLAWGDPSGVSESDALRFQWPSVGRGWEGGLLAFTRSRLKGGGSDHGMLQSYPGGDLALLRDVVNQDNTDVCVVYGTGDKVIPPSAVRGLLEKMEGEGACLRSGKAIRSVEMEGLGHDPFEEDVEGFVEVVERLMGEVEQEE